MKITDEGIILLITAMIESIRYDIEHNSRRTKAELLAGRYDWFLPISGKRFYEIIIRDLSAKRLNKKSINTKEIKKNDY